MIRLRVTQPSTANVLVLAFLVLLAVGCGPKTTPTGKVKGTVTYKGEPLKSGTITFIPKEGKPGYGKVVDGAITEVTTNNPNDGAPLGTNEVTIQAIQGTGDMYAEQKSLIPDSYGDPKKSGLTADIASGKENELKFELK